MKNNLESLEQLYLNLKRDYDSLLEKNQNDLVKIRIKEKMLNVLIPLFRKRYNKSKDKDSNKCRLLHKRYNPLKNNCSHETTLICQ